MRSCHPSTIHANGSHPTVATFEPAQAARSALGFTLVELLVTVACIAILASLLLPAAARARSRAQAVICLQHHGQLSQALFLYAGDERDALPYNLGEDETAREVRAGRFLNWTSSVLSWELDPDNTNTVHLLRGGIGTYLGGAAAVYRCPADTVVSDVQAAAGWHQRVRSTSMNAMMGNAGEFSAGGFNVNNPTFRQFFQLSQVVTPSVLFVFVEEHPDSMNDGYFLNRPIEYAWTDLPASNHGESASLTFADGHAESHRWRWPATRPKNRPDAAALPLAVTGNAREDFDWLMSRTTVPRRPE